MPIIRSRSKLIYYSHIPKCAGSSVELYIRDIGLKPMAFLDHSYLSHAPQTLWNRTSPQHLDDVSLERLFPPAFFDFHFAITRHPIDRFISAFRYQMYVNKTLPEGTEINAFVGGLTKARINEIGWSDNHFLPGNRFLIPKAYYVYFKFEEGLEPVKRWLDSYVIGRDTEFPIGRKNTFAQKAGGEAGDVQLSDASHTKLRDLYAKDFELFDYM